MASAVALVFAVGYQPDPWPTFNLGIEDLAGLSSELPAHSIRSIRCSSFDHFSTL
jgi:hypothetical protein